jgi:cytochrome P450
LKKTLTNKEILSQALFFLVAGYETTANALEFVTYNLAKNPRVQEELIKEIDNVLEKHVKLLL